MGWIRIGVCLCAPAALLCAQGSVQPAREAAESLVQEVPSASIKYRPKSLSYPPLAWLGGVEGTVRCEVTTYPNGGVQEVKVMDGPGLLREGARVFLGSCVFEPVLRDREKVAVRFPWRLDYRRPRDASRMDPPAPASAIRVLVDVAVSPQRVPVIDPRILEDSILKRLESAGLPASTLPNPDPARTLALNVKLLASDNGGGTTLYDVQSNCFLLKDEQLEETAALKSQRRWAYRRLVATPSKREPSVFVAGEVDKMLANLLGTERPPIDSPAAGAVGADRLRSKTGKGVPDPPLEFDFSQIRIKRQPSAPPYPPRAKEERIQGIVIVELTVDERGVPQEAAAVYGPGPLLSTALQYALAWEFEPAKRNGNPCRARFRLTMPFRLR